MIRVAPSWAPTGSSAAAVGTAAPIDCRSAYRDRWRPANRVTPPGLSPREDWPFALLPFYPSATGTGTAIGDLKNQ